MTGLVLVGAGGLAREVLALVRGLAEPDGPDDLVLLDDDPARWGTHVAGVPVVGGLDDVVFRPAHRVVLCVGPSAARRAVAQRLAGLGVTDERLATLRHPTAVVPEGCTVGAGSILLAGVVLTADVRVGRHVVVMPHVTLTHDVVVGDGATLCAGVTLAGGVVVGQAATVGASASVREGVEVGAGATLGMGAALLRDLPAGETWAGVPAARLARADAEQPARVSVARS